MWRTLLRSRRAQGSLEYIMMISAVSIIIVIALAMMLQLKGSALHAFYNSSSGNLANALSSQLANMSLK
jgi:flagellar biosynthesis/type III secretory pathway M-ring protein FliF/YscJ